MLFLRLSFYTLSLILCLIIVVIVGISSYILPDLPEVHTLKEVKLQIPLRIYSADLSLIGEFGEKRRNPINIDAINPSITQAFIAAEDDRFYEHIGVDWQGILRAGYKLISTGEKRQGGSTITMQVARNFFLSREKSYLRKIKEIFLALKIERELKKSEILELYLNKIYLGKRAYGIASAANTYYGKKVDELNLSEIAMIAGLPKAPSSINPIANPERAKIRRDYVLKRMLDLEYISKDQYDEAKNTPIHARKYDAPVQLNAPYVSEMVRKKLLAGPRKEQIYTDGLNVITSIRDKNQLAANQALIDALLNYDRRHGYRGPEKHIDHVEKMSVAELSQILRDIQVLGHLYPAIITKVTNNAIRAFMLGIGQVEITSEGLDSMRARLGNNRLGNISQNIPKFLKVGDIIRLSENKKGIWTLSQIPEVEGAIVSMRSYDGALLALSGGFDFQHSKFNRATQAMRQPGSGFKPFLYSAALASGYTAATIINDSPVVYQEAGTKEWRPQNYTLKYYGPTRLREALVFSRNLVSVKLLQAIGIPNMLNHLEKFGFDVKKIPPRLSIALGSPEFTPMELARAYCVFSNGGYLIEPYYIKTITKYDDSLVFKATPKIVCEDCSEEEQLTTEHAPRVLDGQNVWLINSMTQDVIRYGTGRSALKLGRTDLSGKTGTTNDQRDAWFFGFNHEIVAVSWVGFDEFKPLGNKETGARVALPMWIDYMQESLKDTPPSTMKQPSGLVNIRIDKNTGLRTNPSNPDAIFETFRKRYIPKAQESHITPNNPAQTTEQKQQLF